MTTKTIEEVERQIRRADELMERYETKIEKLNEKIEKLDKKCERAGNGYSRWVYIWEKMTGKHFITEEFFKQNEIPDNKE